MASLLTRVAKVGILVLGAAGCGPGGIAGTPDAGTPDAGEEPVKFGFSFGEPVDVGPDDPSGNGGMGLAVSPSGEISVLYYLDLTSTQFCDANFDDLDVPESALKLARGTMDGFTVSVVENTRSAEGVSAAYDNNGNLHVAYAGGTHGGSVCVSSDLVVASYAGAAGPTVASLADTSANGTTCRLQQDTCNRGDVVGRFASIAFNADGERFVAFQDSHFGYAVETDFEGADLEVFVGGTRYTVDDSAGAANQAVAFAGEGGRVAVAHVVIVDHDFEEGGLKSKGVWLARQLEDQTWESVLVDNTVIPTNQVGAAYHPTRGYAIAYQDPDEKDLLLATSPDGVTWTTQDVERLGNVGSTPAVAFHGDRIVIAYGACSGAQDTGGACNPARDGVRIASEDGDDFNIQTVFNDPDFLEGSEVRMALSGDDVVIAFKSQGTRRMKVVRGSPR